MLTMWPKGQTESLNQTQTVVATFSKPMVPIQELPEGDGSGPLTITPSVKGKYRWLGTSTISFTPAEPFDIASDYIVVIKSGTKALDGSTLAKDVRWTFTTQRPVLLSSRPLNNAKSVDVNSPVLLQFNQQMDAEKATKHIRITEAKTDVPFTVIRPTQEEMRKHQMYVADSMFALMLKPQVPLKKAAKYTVRLNVGLPGAKGGLGMAKEASFSFETYEAMTFLGIDEPVNRDPSRALTFRFKTPVKINDLTKHVTFNPPLQTTMDYSEWSWSSTDASIEFGLQAQTTYTGTISSELKDVFGQELGKDVQFTFNTVSFPPKLSMTTGHGVLEAYGERMYPVTLLNVASVHVQMLKLTHETIVPILRSDTLYSRGNKLNARFDINKKWEPKVQRDVRTTRGLKLDEALGESKRGALLLQISRADADPAMEFVPYLKADVQVTEMGVSAKFSPENVLVWVTTLKDAKPLAGAQVQVRDDSNNVLWQGTTNAEGIAAGTGWGKFENIPRSEWSAPRMWVIVTNGDDIAFTASTWQDGIEPYRFNVNTDWNPQHEPWQGSLFTDRGLYRPGEDVNFKGIFRNRRGNDWAVASGQVILRVYDAQNEQVKLDSIKLNEFGSLAAKYVIPKEARLGYYRIEALLRKKRTDAQEPFAYITGESFRVEAYRVSEFEVNARFRESRYIVGDTVRGSFLAKYLFGGEMRGEKVRWRLRFDPSWFTPEGWEEYSFGRNTWSYGYASGPQSKLLFTKDTVLNAKGTLDVEVKTVVGDIRSTGRLVLEADVTSPSRQTISGRIGTTIHGGEYYIGIRPSSTFVQKGSTLDFKVITVRHDGKVSSGKKLDGVVLKRVWHSVRKASVQGGYSWESQAVDTTLHTFSLTTSGEPQSMTFVPEQSGLYVIQVQGKDGRGNEIVSDTYFYASGSDYVAWERSDDDRIELIADAKKYKPGQTARIIVKNPYEEATALVTVEREGVMKHWRTLLKGSAPEISVPLDEQSLPNVFVSVILLQGRMSKNPELEQATDVGRPSFKIGYVELIVDPGTRHLSLSTKSDKDNYRPGDTVTVTVSANDAAGNPVRAELAVSVADKGTLNLIGYRLPDPFDAFYGSRPLSVVTTESRLQIVQSRSFGEKGEDEGGGGGADLAGIETRGNFKSTAYWNAFLKTDSTGTLTFRFKLPDNLTTFIIMCVAQTKKSEFGYGEASFTVSKQLLLQASIPRFARLGDSFEAGVVVHNYTKENGTVSLRTTSETITMKGKQVVEFPLAAGESKEIRQPFEVKRVGKATFTFQAKMTYSSSEGSETDGLVLSIPLQVPRRKETVADYQAVAGSTDLKLIVPKNSFERMGSIEFTAASTALSGLENSVEYLMTYPYGCIEQKCSAILPIILGREMVEAFGLQPLKGKDAKAVVNNTLPEIARYQIWNGGFMYWPGTMRDAPYASAYVMYVLAVAKKSGYTVSQQVYNRGLEYIQEVLRWQEKMPAYPYTAHTWAATKTLILHTLAIAGKPEPSYYETYFRNLDKIPLVARAMLLNAIAASTKNKKMMQAISSNLLNNIKISPASAHFEEPNVKGLEWCWSSNTRTTGISLQALLAADAFTADKADLPAKIVRWLLDQRKSGRWSNTQENVYVVDALATYFRKYEKEEPKFRAEIRVAATEILSKMFEGRSVKTERVVRDLDAFEKGKELPLHLRKDGTGILYAGMRISYFPTNAATSADEGIAITKTIEPLRPESKLAGSSYAAGSIVKVTLRVISPQQRNFVVVEDPLPAGFEAVNTSLQTESSELGRMLGDIQSEESRYRWWGSFNYNEFHDDRVMLFADQLDAGVHTYTYLARATRLGTFVAPATYTEMMYEPEVFGNTASGKVEIK